MIRLRNLILLFILLGWLAPTVHAQDEAPTPTPPPSTGDELPPIPKVHVVQVGESLASIAAFYGTSVEVLQEANAITDPALLYVGQPLAVPGAQGDPVITGHIVRIGDTLPGLAAEYNTTIPLLAATTRLINPTQLTAGQTITLTSRTGSAAPRPLSGRAHVVQPGETLLMLALRANLTPAALAQLNNLPYPTRLYPGQRLRLPGEQPYQYLPEEWVAIRVHPAAPVQGQTISIYVEHGQQGFPTGTLGQQTLRFAPFQNGYVALVGLDAFAPVGLYSLELSGSGDRPWRPFRQNLLLQAGNYGQQQITVGEELAPLLDPAVRAGEDETLMPYYTQFNEVQHWDGLFQMPGTSHQISAGYGAARSYNGGPYQIFHTGVDFPVPSGSPVWAPANGVVVFAQPTQLRGNVLIIDHGMAVMSAFFHLNAFLVNVGDPVGIGEVIAESGSTGLSNGPHLHWDIRINNVPVNALQWTEEQFP
jgi:murein DD-endopeptidase MepM/ murein hydrolase activator NlpD